MLDKIEAVSKAVNKWLAIFGGSILIAMMFMVTWDVLSRTFANKPLPASVEIGEIMLPYIVFFAFAYTLILGQHVRVTMLLVRLPSTVREGAEIIACLVGMFFFAILTKWGWQHFWQSFAVRELMLAAIPVPWWVGKLGLPIGAFFIAEHFAIMLVQRIARIMRGRVGVVEKEVLAG